MLSKPLALSLCTLALLSACGGGGGGDSSPTPITPTPPVATQPDLPVGTAGIYDISYVGGAFTGLYTLLDDGRFWGLHFVAGDGLAGHPHGPLSSANSISHPEHIAWANFIDDAEKVGAQEANGTFGRTFDHNVLTVDLRGSMGHFTATATEQSVQATGSTKSLYGNPIPLTALAGSYSGIVRTVGINHTQETPQSFAVAADGSFTATAVGCAFSGTLTQYKQTGVFELTAHPTGTSCGLQATMSGIVTPVSYQAGKARLAFQLNSDDNTQTAVFIVTQQ